MGSVQNENEAPCSKMIKIEDEDHKTLNWEWGPSQAYEASLFGDGVKICSFISLTHPFF